MRVDDVAVNICQALPLTRMRSKLNRRRRSWSRRESASCRTKASEGAATMGGLAESGDPGGGSSGMNAGFVFSFS